MSLQVERAELTPDFVQRLERSLATADQERRRRVWYRRIRALLPLILLVGPIVGWRLMLASPDGVHVAIAALAWVTFALDVAVHTDTSLLDYLGLRELPVVVGGLLFVLVSVSILWTGDEK